MADEETPETSEEEAKPRRRRRARARKPAETSGDAAATPVDKAAVEDETARAAASSEASADSGSDDEISPTPADEAAEDEAADVMLEAEDEVDSDSEEEQKPRRAPRRRRRSAEPADEAEAPPKPAPTRRRVARDPNLPPPVVRAQAKYVRSSARKARLVCDHIRGKSVGEARAILATAPRAVARDWSKLLESAIANAENNHELVGEDLYVKAIHADEGPTIKRFRPRAMGRATRIRKRTSHLTILLTPKE